MKCEPYLNSRLTFFGGFETVKRCILYLCASVLYSGSGRYRVTRGACPETCVATLTNLIPILVPCKLELDFSSRLSSEHDWRNFAFCDWLPCQRELGRKQPRRCPPPPLSSRTTAQAPASSPLRRLHAPAARNTAHTRSRTIRSTHAYGNTGLFCDV
jgi:hypothetical protein